MVLVIDGQGGRLGAQIISTLQERYPDIDIVAVGTNSIATTAMIKGGAKKAATGENAVKVNAKRADVIIGPIGIVVADSLLGEVTPPMATAVGASSAKKILIPSTKCDNHVVGVGNFTVAELIDKAVDELKICLQYR